MDHGIGQALQKWLDRVSNQSEWYNFDNPDDLDEDTDVSAVVIEEPVQHIENSIDVDNGILRFANGDTFEGEFFNGSLVNRRGFLTTCSGNQDIYGTWRNNKLDGVAEMTNLQGKEISVFKNGLRHGICRYGLLHLKFPDLANANHFTYRKFGPSTYRQDNLQLVAYFHSGRPVGVAWKGLIGGAYLARFNKGHSLKQDILMSCVLRLDPWMKN